MITLRQRTNSHLITSVTFLALILYLNGITEGVIFSYSENGKLVSPQNSSSNYLSNYPGFGLNISKYVNASEARFLDILASIHFNNSIPVSVLSDPTTGKVYVTVNPINYTLSSPCLEGSGSKSNFTALSSCSAIYILDSASNKLDGVIPLSQGEKITDMTLDPPTGRIYAVGEYNYAVSSNDTGEDVLYQDDVTYMINYSSDRSNVSNAASIGTNESSEFIFANITRVSLYGETEEGKEGDAKAIAFDNTTRTIYAGLVYFEGGKEGIYLVPAQLNPDSYQIIERAADGIQSQNYGGDTGILGYSSNSDGGSNVIFVPFNGSGPGRIVLDEVNRLIYASDREGDFIAVVNASSRSGEIIEKIILQSPRAMSVSSKNSYLYVGSGDSYWFNIIDTNSNKVVSANDQIVYPISSSVNINTGDVYVIDCDYCAGRGGSSIYHLESDGSTITSKNYDNINFVANLAIDPEAEKLYVIGTDPKTGATDVHVIKIAVN